MNDNFSQKINNILLSDDFIDVIHVPERRIGKPFGALRKGPKDEKICSFCKTQKPLSEFKWVKTQQWFRSSCKICEKKN